MTMCFYAALVLVVPGPTNTLLFSSGISVGLARTLPLVLAEAAGYVIAISVWGFSLLTFAVAHPHVLTVIKVACSSYLLLLAINMWTQGRMEEDKRAKAVTWRNLFVATLLNPKAFLLASTAFPLQAFHDAGNGVVAFGAFLLVLVPIGTGWASLGRVTSVLASGPRHITTLLRSASMLLVLFSGTLLYSLVK
ncbi:lysine transporter LysE [Burkholderia sp. AU27893]|uniref:Lysine transporter LysE n=2 Tax=Burkholderiaceae TaxID=119060 RepID=A0A2S5E8P8_9BURK|nr:lysine transporter LysE [Burkholderia sp. AU27893]OXI94636.1 lysine transporter LysE [Burkholderia sp. AU33803]POZ87664.1 lysine transporter LysE [Burkholderia contaminans]PRD84208.1 lysine transporter LysE [Burkholderia contaminans]